MHIINNFSQVNVHDAMEIEEDAAPPKCATVRARSTYRAVLAPSLAVGADTLTPEVRALILLAHMSA